MLACAPTKTASSLWLVTGCMLRSSLPSVCASMCITQYFALRVPSGSQERQATNGTLSGYGPATSWSCHAFQTPGVSPTAETAVRTPLPLSLGPGSRLAARWNRHGANAQNGERSFGLKGVKESGSPGRRRAPQGGC